jgi:hypothetical protein
MQGGKFAKVYAYGGEYTYEDPRGAPEMDSKSNDNVEKNDYTQNSTQTGIRFGRVSALANRANASSEQHEREQDRGGDTEVR